MINFDYLEDNLVQLSERFFAADPFEHVIIDNFCDADSLREALDNFPSYEFLGLSKSRDYIFAKNKFERAGFDMLSAGFSQLKAELISPRFEKFICDLTGQKIFIDPEFHGGGIHQGGQGSFLDMHIDFNYHPVNPSWFRNVNILIYLNEDWRDYYAGQLKLADGRKANPIISLVEPLFNRAVIMFTRDYTLHGYDPISFPKGSYRRSIAAYGYTQMEQEGIVRTTVWYPEKSGFFKRFLGLHMPKLVRVKSAIFGSGTHKNK